MTYSEKMDQARAAFEVAKNLRNTSSFNSAQGVAIKLKIEALKIYDSEQLYLAWCKTNSQTS